MSTQSRLFLGMCVLALVALVGWPGARADVSEGLDEPSAIGSLEQEEPRPPATGPLARLGRGVVNIALSPLEIPATMLRVGAEHNAFYGLWAGGLEGLGNGAVRLAAGILEAGTFPLPSDHLPLYTKRLGERALPPQRVPTDITRP